MADSKEIPYKCNLAVCVRGFPFPNTPLFKTENIRNALDYRPQDGDVVLCSYPKTGSTWMQYLVWQIVNKSQSLPEFNALAFHLVPMMEVTDVNKYKNLKEPRMYKNHFPYYILIENPKAKYIYTYRNPLDVIVSFYNFSKEVYEQKNLDFNEYVELFMDGKVGYGNFFDHFWSFYRKKGQSNLLLVSYEDLKADPSSQILRIAKFLGDEYHNNLLSNDDLLKQIVAATSFDNMKKNLKLTFVVNEEEKIVENFFRKGVVGDGKKTLTTTQIEKLQREIKFRMEGTEFAELWCS